ncbi:FAD:protein FMN transferase [Galbibacter sp. PAP.153]|uniref:FAD:protein FMN transferase n=1 Tax=Galbibacter sp. PAP.153 TaxID=3104623 RepID=UPI00300912E8
MYYKVAMGIFSALFIIACQQEKSTTYQDLKGDVFGTYYHFQIDSEKDYTKQIDSVFQQVNIAANTYVAESQISILNKTGVYNNPSATFLDMLQKAKHYYTETNGYFNPAIYPLISTWKSKFENRSEIDTLKVNKLLGLTAFDSILTVETTKITFLKPNAAIDLSAMGEGYTLDALASILDKSGVKNYMLEIGGEMQCRGLNQKGKTWLIGIEAPNFDPLVKERSVISTVRLKNTGLSTSGSYRKFYYDSLGKKHAHIVNPKTGFPVEHHLLSVSIKAKSSAIADTYATACMAMGEEKSKKFIENDPEIEGYLIVANVADSTETWHSEKFFD